MHTLYGMSSYWFLALGVTLGVAVIVLAAWWHQMRACWLVFTMGGSAGITAFTILIFNLVEYNHSVYYGDGHTPCYDASWVLLAAYAAYFVVACYRAIQLGYKLDSAQEIAAREEEELLMRSRTRPKQRSGSPMCHHVVVACAPEQPGTPSFTKR